MYIVVLLPACSKNLRGTMSLIPEEKGLKKSFLASELSGEPEKMSSFALFQTVEFRQSALHTYYVTLRQFRFLLKTQTNS
jgi:hypothetical protein